MNVLTTNTRWGMTQLSVQTPQPQAPRSTLKPPAVGWTFLEANRMQLQQATSQPAQLFLNNLRSVGAAMGVGSLLASTGIKLAINHGIRRLPFNRKELMIDLAIDAVVGLALGSGFGTFLQVRQLKKTMQETQEQMNRLWGQSMGLVTVTTQLLSGNSRT
jgi:hypothetical protein